MGLTGLRSFPTDRALQRYLTTTSVGRPRPGPGSHALEHHGPDPEAHPACGTRRAPGVALRRLGASPVADAIRDGHTRTVIPDRLYRSGPFASRNPGAWPGGHHRHVPDPCGSPVASSPVSTNRRAMHTRARTNGGGAGQICRPSRGVRAGRQGGPR
jgi:hypothetical protein